MKRKHDTVCSTWNMLPSQKAKGTIGHELVPRQFDTSGQTEMFETSDAEALI